MTLPKMLVALAAILMIAAFSVACASAEPGERQQPAQPEAAAPAAASGQMAQQAPQAPAAAAPAAPAATAIPLDVQPAPAVAGIQQRPSRPLPTPVPEALARFGGNLRWISQGSVGSLDPHVTSAAVTLTYGYNMYDTLVSWDEEGALQPQMLEDWSVEDGGATFVFTLREGQTFHNGDPVTSDDVIASMHRWREKSAYGSFFNDALIELAKIDDNRLSAKFSEPVGIFLQGLGIPTASYPVIMPADVAATPSSELVSDHTGSGPFKFAEWNLGP